MQATVNNPYHLVPNEQYDNEQFFKSLGYLAEIYSVTLGIDTMKAFYFAFKEKQKFPYMPETFNIAKSKTFYRDSSKTGLRFPTIEEFKNIHEEYARSLILNKRPEQPKILMNDKQKHANYALAMHLIQTFKCDSDMVMDMVYDGRIIADQSFIDSNFFSEKENKKKAIKQHILKNYQNILNELKGTEK